MFPFLLKWYSIMISLLFLMQRCILLDIEGTTIPISFISDVLFPYTHNNVRKHLAATYDSEETQNDISFLRSQVRFFCSFYAICFVACLS